MIVAGCVSRIVLNYLALKSFDFEVHDQYYSRHMRTKFHIYVFITMTGFDTSAGGLIVPDRITRSIVSVSALTWFILYLRVYYYDWFDTSAGGLIVPDRIIRSVVFRH